MEYGWDHFAFYGFIYIIERFVFELQQIVRSIEI